MISGEMIEQNWISESKNELSPCCSTSQLCPCGFDSLHREKTNEPNNMKLWKKWTWVVIVSGREAKLLQRFQVKFGTFFGEGREKFPIKLTM